MQKKAIMSGIFSAVFVMLAVFLGAYYWYETFEVSEDTPQTVVSVDTDIQEDIIVTERIDVEYESPISEEQESVSAQKKFIEPVANGKVVRKFFDLNNSEEDKLNSIVEYNGVYRPSVAVSYSCGDTACDVVAVANGTIQSVSTDSLLGKRVIMQCGNYSIIYYSIDNIVVSEGQQVVQGEKIGICGTNTYDGDLGKHISISVMLKNEYIDFEKLLEL